MVGGGRGFLVGVWRGNGSKGGIPLRKLEGGEEVVDSFHARGGMRVERGEQVGVWGLGEEEVGRGVRE